MRSNNKFIGYWRDYIVSPFLAGVCISIACIVYIKVGGVAGAVLFGFGLLTVIHYGFKLYTGTAGFIMDSKDYWKMILILIMNAVGCWVTATMMKYVEPTMIEQTKLVVEKRLGLNIYQCGLMGIGCGFIMTAAVKYAREGKWLPLLFGVPVFILCGFLHSIADAFYISMMPIISEDLFERWEWVVVGNLIGCNLVRLLKFTENS